jgi:hypothetical protein
MRHAAEFGEPWIPLEELGERRGTLLNPWHL